MWRSSRMGIVKSVRSRVSSTNTMMNSQMMMTRVGTACVLLAALCNAFQPALVPNRGVAFLPSAIKQGKARHHAATVLHINLGWLSGRGDSDSDSRDDFRDGKGNIGGVAGTMDSMDSFKKAQRIGKMTANVLQELASTMVEGSAADGRVKVVLDCQQKPISLSIDDTYYDASNLADLTNDILMAMKDGYARSLDKMDDKTKNFYADLGLPPR